jgi:hypothetical protein
VLGGKMNFTGLHMEGVMEQKLELRQLWEVLQKRWKIMVILLLGVALISGVTVLIRLFMGTHLSRLPDPPPIKILNFQMLTIPSRNSDEMSNSLTVDLSGAPDSTQVTGFSVTVDQSCDLQLDGINKTIPLIGGQATLINLDDLVAGTHGENGISLRTFRMFCGHIVTIQGEFKKDGRIMKNLSMELKL